MIRRQRRPMGRAARVNPKEKRHTFLAEKDTSQFRPSTSHSRTPNTLNYNPHFDDPSKAKRFRPGSALPTQKLRTSLSKGSLRPQSAPLARTGNYATPTVSSCQKDRTFTQTTRPFYNNIYDNNRPQPHKWELPARSNPLEPRELSPSSKVVYPYPDTDPRVDHIHFENGYTVDNDNVLMGPRRGQRGNHPASRVRLTDDVEYLAKLEQAYIPHNITPTKPMAAALRGDMAEDSEFRTLAEDRNTAQFGPFNERAAQRTFLKGAATLSDALNETVREYNPADTFSRNINLYNNAHDDAVAKARTQERRSHRINESQQRIDNYVTSQGDYEQIQAQRADNVRKQQERYDNAVKGGYVNWSFPPAQNIRLPLAQSQ